MSWLEHNNLIFAYNLWHYNYIHYVAYIYISCIIYVCIKVWKWKKTYIKFCIYMFGQAKLDSDREKLVRMLLRGSWRNNCASLKTIYLAFFFFVFLGWSSFLLKTFYWKCVKLCLYLKKKKFKNEILKNCTWKLKKR